MREVGYKGIIQMKNRGSEITQEIINSGFGVAKEIRHNLQEKIDLSFSKMRHRVKIGGACQILILKDAMNAKEKSIRGVKKNETV